MSRLALLTAGVLVVLVAAFPAAANAAFVNGANGKNGGGGGHNHGGGGGSSICGSGGTSNCGFDVSYPQCGASFPTSAAFGVVGVNDGLANDLNPCLGPSSAYPNYTQSELYWALTTSGAVTGQPKASLYVNTADPGNMYNKQPIADWPTSSIGSDPYGSCATMTVRSRGQTYTVGANSDACAWQYGYNMAAQDASWLTSAADAVNGQESTVVAPDTPASYAWWLDVETANSWQADTTMNLADLEGMIAGFEAAGASTIGVYSTASQWGSIIGTSLASSSSLYGVPTWIPGATTYSGAQSNCTSQTSFTGGTVTLTQWTGTIDSDYVCS